jgi:hypothetical protein
MSIFLRFRFGRNCLISHIHIQQRPLERPQVVDEALSLQQRVLFLSAYNRTSFRILKSKKTSKPFTTSIFFSKAYGMGNREKQFQNGACLERSGFDSFKVLMNLHCFGTVCGNFFVV